MTEIEEIVRGVQHMGSLMSDGWCGEWTEGERE